MSRKSEGKVCCVPGCPNAQLKNVGLTFYTFPNRDYEVQRKKLWIARVRREGNENGLWVPTKHTRICAEHFLGGVKSNNPTEENFNPTIFPWKPAKESCEARRQRLALRNEKKSVNSARNSEVIPRLLLTLGSSNTKVKSVQTNRAELRTHRKIINEILLENTTEPEIKTERSIEIPTDISNQEMILETTAEPAVTISTSNIKTETDCSHQEVILENTTISNIKTETDMSHQDAILLENATEPAVTMSGIKMEMDISHQEMILGTTTEPALTISNIKTETDTFHQEMLLENTTIPTIKTETDISYQDTLLLEITTEPVTISNIKTETDISYSEIYNKLLEEHTKLSTLYENAMESNSSLRNEIEILNKKVVLLKKQLKMGKIQNKS